MRQQPRSGTRSDDATRLVGEVARWHHRMEVVHGVHSPGETDPLPLLRNLNLPARLDGMRVLDVGCLDGFFSFELERRGAEVTAAHGGEATPGFSVAHLLRGSHITSVRGPVYDLTRHDLGTFDLVLFLGRLHHLRHPLLALDVLSELVRVGGRMVVECHAIDRGLIGPDGHPYAMGDPALRLMQFYPDSELSGDASNWWAPSLSCLEAMVSSAPFHVDEGRLWAPGRALLHATRLQRAVLTAPGESEFPGAPDLLGRRSGRRGDTGEVRDLVQVLGGAAEIDGPDPAIHL